MKPLYYSFLFTVIAYMGVSRHAMAQSQGSIRGTVTSSDGNPASFVSVGLKEVRKGAITTEDGAYLIKGINEGTYTLRITFVGLVPQEKQITVTAGQTAEANFTLTENADQLTEVEVTGTKQTVTLGKAPIAPLDLPQMTGIVSSIVIENQQISRLGDALRNVSGVSLTQQRGGVAETFSARGYSIGIAGAGGSIFKNGVLSNTMGFPEASTLESIEVLKGSSSLLYGNVSGGLIINMVTKKPKFTSGGEVSMRVGSYNLYKPIVDVYGPLSKNLAFRVVGTYENAQSYRDVVKSNRVYVNPSLLYKLGSKTTILLQGDYLKSNLTPDNGVGSLNQNQDAVIPATIPRSRFINTLWAYNKVDQASGSINIDHAFNTNWKLTAIGAAQDTKVSAYGAGIPNNNIAANGDWNRSLSRTQTSERNYTGQLNLNGRVSTGSIEHQLLAGTDLVGIVSTSNAFTITSNGVAVPIYDKFNILDPNKYERRTDIPDANAISRTTSPSVRMGLYAQDLISLTNKLKVLAGLRWSQQKTVQTTVLNLTNQVETRGAAETKIDGAFSPKVALIYQPTRTTSLFGSYSNNFTINTGLDIYGQILKPSIVDQFEAGIKNDLFNGIISANLGVYHIVNSDFAQMAAVRLDGTPNIDANVKEFTGQTTSDGLEVDITGNLSKNVYFITGYGYNYMRYTKTSPVKGSFIEGERLINNPAHTANATLFYTFDLPRLRGLKLGASAFYTGARNGGNNNTYGQTPAFSRLIPLNGFTTLDVSAGYTYRKISLLAKLSNITNELNYLIHDRYSIMPIPPRQFITTLSYRF
ncbi:TonB-dependent receptor [Spirosoma utsteinense]|uniref:Iron complex outermembrane receptor protein n=1 Tax=Spirosoma utsteinense TaxID=2585773 RepID=A0ABR6W4E6_9BACT|nr:TonB-dependent receptor [Spirosoma utsteinense]MBC3786643.1 iron complex outermembrane receptor protein [Spirosoma utsteinense]MBC3791006.1 iron complex outermembrane receptor protein [Spirosoma utsteinense]